MNARLESESLEQEVARAREGDKLAFEVVFRLTHDYARKIAYSVVGPAGCEDVVQESYLLVFRKLKQLKDLGAFKGWLCRIVLHVAYRYEDKNPDLEQLPAQLKGGRQPEDVLNALLLRRALRQLHSRDRDVLILREFLGLSYEDVSHALQVPLGTVRSRLNKARGRLRERLTALQ